MLSVRASNKSKRQKLYCLDESKTDPSAQKGCCINHIVAQYTKTGMFPHFPEKTPHYIDTSELPNVLEAHQIVADANEMFYELPLEIRKGMDHNPANLETYLSDDKNTEILIKYELIEKPKIVDIPKVKEKEIEKVVDKKSESVKTD